MSVHHSLFELNQIIKKTLDKELEASYWLIAEIADLRLNQTGHCYLELVQKEEERVIAKSRATIWAYTYGNLSLWFEKMTGESLKPGLKILCNVTIQFHEIYGLSINIKDIDASFTLGERERKKQEVILKLEEDGVIEMNKSLQIDRVISNIAIISSPTAAGLEDFMNQLVNNNYGYEFDTRLYKASMQGDQAAESMINALHTIHNSSEHYDIIVIIRGGGSRIDLDCFDDYELNFCACQIPIPLVTGIGHERDESILDIIATKSLKTPTAVAEWIINKSLSFESEMLDTFSKIANRLDDKLKYEQSALSILEHQLKSCSERLLFSKEHELERYILQIKNAVDKHLYEQSSKIDGMKDKLDYINPKSILKRGYTLTLKNGKNIHTENVKVGDKIETITLSSKLESMIVSKEKNEKK